MRASCWIAAGDDALVADTGRRELKCSYQCIGKGQAVGGSPCIVAGVGAVVADTGCGELECSRECM